MTYHAPQDLCLMRPKVPVCAKNRLLSLPKSVRSPQKKVTFVFLNIYFLEEPHDVFLLQKLLMDFLVRMVLLWDQMGNP